MWLIIKYSDSFLILINKKRLVLQCSFFRRGTYNIEFKKMNPFCKYKLSKENQNFAVASKGCFQRLAVSAE